MRGRAMASESGWSAEPETAPPPDGKELLFYATVMLHILAVIVALIVVGFTFGFLWVSLAFVGVTVFWVFWARKYIETENYAKHAGAIEAEKRQRATFTDPRTPDYPPRPVE